MRHITSVVDQEINNCWETYFADPNNKKLPEVIAALKEISVNRRKLAVMLEQRQ